jgi:hypothetical protein
VQADPVTALLFWRAVRQGVASTAPPSQSAESWRRPLPITIDYTYCTDYKYGALGELYQSNSNFPVVNIYSLSPDRAATIAILKGQCHKIFDPRFFSSNNTSWAPDSRAKAFLNSASNSPRYDGLSNTKIVHAVRCQ